LSPFDRRKRSRDADERTEITAAVPVLARTLSTIVEHDIDDRAIRRQDLVAGDLIIVRTRNSVYLMWVLGEDRFAVRGGWFDQHEESPVTVRINGCTYGQSAIRHDVVAAPGLFLEFGNNVRTTRIQDVRIERQAGSTVLH